MRIGFADIGNCTSVFGQLPHQLTYRLRVIQQVLRPAVEVGELRIEVDPEANSFMILFTTQPLEADGRYLARVANMVASALN